MRDKVILIAGMIADRIGPLTRDLGLSELQFGVLIASANVTLGFISPYCGRKSPIIGRRPVSFY